MCGRINVSDNEGVRLLLAMLGMEVWPSREPRFNVAPTQTLDVITAGDDEPALTAMKWGLLPSWAKPGTFSAPLINARCETIREKPSFRHLVAQYRVLIPINGFYEWRRSGKTKTPFHFYAKDQGAMFIAGLYQPVEHATDKPQCCIVTTAANDTMGAIHHRMPVILDASDALSWIAPGDNATIDKLMKPANNDVLQSTEVSDYVNNARNEGPECLAAQIKGDLFD